MKRCVTLGEGLVIGDCGFVLVPVLVSKGSASIHAQRGAREHDGGQGLTLACSPALALAPITHASSPSRDLSLKRWEGPAERRARRPVTLG